MKICPTHNTLIQATDIHGCPTCRQEFTGILGASGLVTVRPPHVEDVYDLPGTENPGCQSMTADAAEGHSEVSCVRPHRHEGDCESLAGTLWDHDHDTGCCDA